jgi:cyclopropane-fatty-acyl-phospholipid synthase
LPEGAVSSSESKAYWEAQTDSGHRLDDERFYKEKAEEHFYIMSADHRTCDCVDIGCGAGELLLYFSDFVDVRLGIDYSESMLEAARKRLIGKDIALINGDALTLLERLDVKIWIACQSINQYADHNTQRRVLDVFVGNARAEAIYLYDCVDPIRYRILKSGISYSPIKYKGISWIKQRLYISAMTTLLAMKVLLGLNERPWQRVGGPAMGY